MWGCVDGCVVRFSGMWDCVAGCVVKVSVMWGCVDGCVVRISGMLDCVGGYFEQFWGIARPSSLQTSSQQILDSSKPKTSVDMYRSARRKNICLDLQEQLCEQFISRK